MKISGHELEENPQLDNSVLLKQIELREHLEEIKLDPSNELARAEFKRERERELDSLKFNLKEAFSIGNSEAIKNLIYEQQFLTKLIGEVELFKQDLTRID